MINWRYAAAAVLMTTSLAGVTPAAAAVLAESHFDADAEGWRNGEFTLGGAPGAVTWNPGGFIAVTDNYIYNAFLAPSAFLGDRSAANGGTLSFDLGSALDSDGALTPFVTLAGAGFLIYGGIFAGPAATNGFDHYEVVLRPENFLLGDPGPLLNGAPVSDALFALILKNLSQAAITGDLHAGEDLVRLDNVVLTAGAIPEPSTWALMIAGFGLSGVVLRRRGWIRP